MRVPANVSYVFISDSSQVIFFLKELFNISKKLNQWQCGGTTYRG